jgi:hypothetical protein
MVRLPQLQRECQLIRPLNRVILPLLGEYADSGYREPKDRLMYSLRSNGRYQLIVLSLGSLGAVYFVLQNGFKFESMKALVMGLAYAWGLILAIYLMGHGLVAIPRRLFRDASLPRRLKKLQSQAPKTYEALMEASDELKDYEDQVGQLKSRRTGTAKMYREWVNELSEMTSIPELRSTTISAIPTSRTTVPQVITERYLADLARQLKRTRHKKLRYLSEWNNILTSALRTQAILDAAPSRKLTFPGSTPSLLSPTMRYHLHAHVYPFFAYMTCGILTIASAAIVWSELTKSMFPRLSLVSVTIIGTTSSKDAATHKIHFHSQVAASLWLSYMSISALYSITVLPLWGNRALVKRVTYEESAAWYSAQVAKLTVPLAYNFLTFLPKEVSSTTQFHRFLGQLVESTPLGRGFSGYFPILLVLPVVAALFGLYGRIKRIAGFGDLLDDEEESEGSRWREGKSLIDREVRAAGGISGIRLREGTTDEERASLIASDPAQPSQFERAPRAERSAAAAATPRPPRANQTSQEPDDEEGNGAVADFFHRVRNTFDTVDKPSWVKVPRWMGGDGDDAPSEPSEPWNWGQMFGGRGQVRL